VAFLSPYKQIPLGLLSQYRKKATAWIGEEFRFDSWKYQIHLSLQHPDYAWGLSRILVTGFRELFTYGKEGGA
jgi:hypothetical protein